MRQPQTFVLTLLLDECQPTLFRGRALAVTTGAQATFLSIEELLCFLQDQTRFRILIPGVEEVPMPPDSADG